MPCLSNQQHVRCRTQALVLDDNRMTAALALPLAGTVCSCRFQQPEDSFYECKLLQLQWWRTTNSLRCARGGHHACRACCERAGCAPLAAGGVLCHHASPPIAP
jgi:hypothetical protein